MAAAGALAALAACTSAPPVKPPVYGAPGGFSILAALDDLPASALAESPMVVVGDLSRASDLAGLTRPDPGTADQAAVRAWLRGIDGRDTAAGEGPVAIRVLKEVEAALTYYDLAREEVGWSGLDIASFAGVEGFMENHFAALRGKFDPNRIDAALGGRHGQVWYDGTGDDFSIDLDQMRPLSPNGAPRRLALRDGVLGLSYSTPLIGAWLRGGAPLSGVRGFADVAKALDEHGAYSAILLNGADQGGGTELAPFDALGGGLAVDGGQAVGVLAYAHRAEQDAAQNARALEHLFRDGTSNRYGEPLSTVFDHVQVTQSGTMVTVTFGFPADRRPYVLWVAMEDRVKQPQEEFLRHS